MVCGQVWWPILGICPLHLTHPSAHSQQWTHTWSSGQPYCGARGAVGGSVPCSRVSPQSWYWRWREHLLFTPPTDNPCRTWESNRQPLGYKSNSLTIRPRLPRRFTLCYMKTMWKNNRLNSETIGSNVCTVCIFYCYLTSKYIWRTLLAIKELNYHLQNWCLFV